MAVGCFVQPQPFGLLNLNDASIMHDDLHHAEAQRADLLDDQLKPFQIVFPTHRQLFLRITRKDDSYSSYFI